MSILFAPFAQLRLAFMLLTRLPMGQLRAPVPKLQEIGWAYPIVGAVIGALVWGFISLGHWLGLPANMLAVLVLTFSVIITGGLHFDGLADCADGLGGHDRPRRLEIMHDSRLGSYGALSLILTAALWLAAFSTIEAHVTAAEVIAIAALSRFAMLILQRLLPSARSDGMGHLAGAPSWRQVIIAGAFCALILIFCNETYFYILPAILCSTAFLYWRAKVLLGGQTGDVLGAAQIIGEVTCLCALWLAYQQAGLL